MTSPARAQPELCGFRDNLRRDWLLVLVVAAVAALVRTACLVQLYGTPFAHYLTMDAAGYDAWALNIAGGNWLGDRVFYQEPLYPYLLAVLHAIFGPGLAAVFVIQLVAGAANCVLAQLLAARLTGSRWAGLVAGLLLAFGQTMVFYDLQVLKVVWTLLLLLLSVHVLISAWERAECGPGKASGRICAGLWLAAGVLLALLGLMQGQMLLCVPFVLLWIVLVGRKWGWRRLSAAAGLVALGVVLPLALVCARNYVVGGDLVLSSSHAGFNFYIGNHAGADGAYQYVTGVREDPRFEGDDARVVASRAAGRTLKASEASAWWFSQATTFIKDDPGAWSALMARKAARFVNAEEIMDTWSPDFLAERAPALRAAFVTYGMLIPAALVGVVVVFRLGPRGHLVNLLVLAVALSTIVFYVFGRYRMPVVPLFAVLAAAAVVAFARWVRERRYAPAAAALAGAALVAVAALAPITSATSAAYYRAAEHHNLGTVYIGQAGDAAKAKEEFERALAKNPQYSKAMTSLAQLCLKEGRTEEARTWLLAAVRADDMDATAHFLLAGMYQKEGNRSQAVSEMEAAVHARPGFVEACSDLGAMYIERGEFAKAAGVLEEAAEFSPRSHGVWQNLGGCYYQLGRFAKAREAWDRALALATTPEQRRPIEENLRRLPAKRTP